MSSYREEIAALEQVCQENGSPWGAISPESAARMRLQNRFKTGLDIARYTGNAPSRLLMPLAYAALISGMMTLIATTPNLVANEALADAPESVNDSPYESGWICKIRLSDTSQLEALMDADSYATHAEEEEH